MRLAVLISVAIASTAANAIQYKVIELPLEAAYDINDDGVIAGTRIGDSLRYVASIYRPDSGVVDVRSGSGDAYAFRINQSGQVIGSGAGEFFWDPINGVHVFSLAHDVHDLNDRGDVVGMRRVTYPNGAMFHGFLWNSDGTTIDIGPPPLTASQAGVRFYGVNEDRAIVGSYMINGLEQATQFVGSTRTTLWQESSIASRISDTGHVVGQIYGRSVPTTFLRLNDGSSYEVAGARFLGVTNDGVAIGRKDLGSGVYRAVRFTPQDGLQDLNSLLDESREGWNLIHAESANRHGQIVGYGAKNGFYRAFQLDPVPEPATITALTAGLIVLARRRKR